MRALVGLAGPRGSGKTTIAKQLESKHGYVHASFGDFVRRESARRGLPDDTNSLQTLGHTLISELGWERFCRGVVNSAANADLVVVDGIRHVAAVGALRTIASPGQFVLVFVDVDNGIAAARIAQRARVGDEASSEMTNELRNLRAAADLLVEGNSDNASSMIAAWASHRSINRD